jgi:hypothetical protein
VADNQDNPGIRVPPPLIYLLPLVAGLALDRRFLHVPFLPRRVTRPLGWALFGSSWLVGDSPAIANFLAHTFGGLQSNILSSHAMGC